MGGGGGFETCDNHLFPRASPYRKGHRVPSDAPECNAARCSTGWAGRQRRELIVVPKRPVKVVEGSHFSNTSHPSGDHVALIIRYVLYLWIGPVIIAKGGAKRPKEKEDDTMDMCDL